MRASALILFLLLGFNAEAANFRFSYITSGGTVTVNAPELSAGQQQVVEDWIWAFYAPRDTTPGSPTFGQILPRNPTNLAEAWRNWARAAWKGTASAARGWKLEQDRAAVPPTVVPEE